MMPPALDAEGRVARPALEVADIFRDDGPSVAKQSHRRSCEPRHLKVMSRIERGRTAALGPCRALTRGRATTPTSLTNCRRNGTCPKCQGAAAKQCSASVTRCCCRFAPYFQSCLRCGAVIGESPYHNKAGIYDILFKARAETRKKAPPTQATSAPPSVSPPCSTWGSELTITRMSTPSDGTGGISLDGRDAGSPKPAGLITMPVGVALASVRARS